MSENLGARSSVRSRLIVLGVLTLLLALAAAGDAAGAVRQAAAIHASYPAAAIAGRTVKVTGSLPKVARVRGVRVALQRKSGRAWIVATTAKAGRKGKFTLSFKPSASLTKVTLRVRARAGKRTVGVGKAHVLKLGRPERPVAVATPVPTSTPTEPPTSATPAPSVTPVPTVEAPPVAVPDPAEVTAAPAPGEPGQLVLNGPTNLQPGDYVATGIGSATPDGFLGQVTAVTTASGQTVLTTTPAALTDVLPEGHIDQTIDTPEETGTAARRASVDLTCTKGGHGFTVSRPTVKLTKSINFVADWGVFSLDSAKLTGTITAKASTVASADGSIHCAIDRTKIASFPGTPVEFAVGPIPVVLTPNAAVYLDGTADANASVSASVNLTATGTAGIQYRKGAGVSPIASFANAFTYSPPTVNATASVIANLTPTVNVLVYGIAGPELAFKAGLDFEADIHSTPWWTLEAPVDLTAQLVVPPLKLSTEKLHVYKHRFALADAGGPFPGTGTDTPRLDSVTPIDGGSRFWFTPPMPQEDLTPRQVCVEGRDGENGTVGYYGCWDYQQDGRFDAPGVAIAPGRQFRIYIAYDFGQTPSSDWVTPAAATSDGWGDPPVLNSVTPIDGGSRFWFSPPPPVEDLTPRQVCVEGRDGDNGTVGYYGCWDYQQDGRFDAPGVAIAPGRQFRIYIAYDYGRTASSDWLTPAAAASDGWGDPPILNSVAPVDGGTRFRFTPPPPVEDLTPRQVCVEGRDGENGTVGYYGCWDFQQDGRFDAPGVAIAPGRQFRIYIAYDYGRSASSNWKSG